MNKQT